MILSYLVFGSSRSKRPSVANKSAMPPAGSKPTRLPRDWQERRGWTRTARWGGWCLRTCRTIRMVARGEGRILTPTGPLACRLSMYRGKRTCSRGKSVRSTREHEEPSSWTGSLSVRGAFSVPLLVKATMRCSSAGALGIRASAQNAQMLAPSARRDT